MTLYCDDCGEVLGATDAQITDTIYCVDCAVNHNIIVEDAEDEEEDEEVVEEEEKEEEKK